MWIGALGVALAAPGDSVVEALLASPPEARLEVLRALLVNEPDAEVRARLVAVGRLGDLLLTADEATLRAYVQGMVHAETPEARSLVAAAAVDGAVDAEGAPTLTHEQAMALYLDRAVSIGPVNWYLCWDQEGVRSKVFKGLEVDGVWVVEPFDLDDRRVNLRLGRVPGYDCVAVDGWSVFVGGEPVGEASALPGRLRPSPGTCEPHERVVRVTESFVANTAPTRWYARPPRRPDECLSADDARAWLPSINDALRESLGLSAADVAGSDLGMPTFPTLNQCASPGKQVAEICSTFPAIGSASVP